MSEPHGRSRDGRRPHDGLLVVDKPVGPTSFDVIRRLRPVLRTRAVGHTGTLDPAASGVLCVCVGWALKLIRFLDHDIKVYRATVSLGQVTETDDAEGAVVETRPVDVDRDRLEAVLGRFVGTIEQTPPAYSAVKRGGVRAYRRARRGEVVELEARRVRIDALAIEVFEPPRVDLTVTCGGGTYIRSLARDIGGALGCGAHLSALRRIQNGPFTLEQATGLEALVECIEVGEPPLVSPSQMLSHLPRLDLEEPTLTRVGHGRRIQASMGLDAPDGRLVRLTNGERLVAVAQVEPADPDGGGSRWLQPIRVRPGIAV